MSDADNLSFPGFGKLVPGFDFLQNLTRQATNTAAQGMPKMPGLGSWVAPTLNVEELEKRIDELKAVQFWLDQNAVALKATIQALEVQKMTLATLKGMNFNMGEVANAFTLRTPGSAAASPAGDAEGDSDAPAADKGHAFAGLEIPASTYGAAKAAEHAAANAENATRASEEKPAPKARPAKAKEEKPAETPAAGVADPMQWWGALTQQFQAIATGAMKEAAKASSIDPAKDATAVVKTMADNASKAAADSARAMNTALRSSQAWPTPAAGKKAAPAKASAKTKTKAKAKPKAPARKAAP